MDQPSTQGGDTAASAPSLGVAEAGVIGRVTDGLLARRMELD
jgi:hypothetical protein